MATPETPSSTLPAPLSPDGGPAPAVSRPGPTSAAPSANAGTETPTASGTTAADQTAAAHLDPSAPATSAATPAERLVGVVGKWIKDLSKVEALLAALGILVTVVLFAFSSFDSLRTSWNLFWHKPLDVSLRSTADKIDVVPGKTFVARVAVENYTDWYKPYVKLTAWLVPADNGPAAKDAYSPPRLDPPDIVRIDPCGRSYVEVSARINVPGKYVLKVASRPLYDVPAAGVRRDNSWDHLVANTPQQGEPWIESIPVIAHRAEDFGDPKLVEVMPDKTNCRLSVTLTTGQNYPYGLRITASTQPHSRTWFHAVDPAVDPPEASADVSEAAITNGAYIKWKVEHMEALEMREFAIFLDSHVEHDPTQWEEIIKGIRFSVEALRETDKP